MVRAPAPKTLVRKLAVGRPAGLVAVPVVADTLATTSRSAAWPSRLGDRCPSGTRLCMAQRRQNREQHVGIRAVSEWPPGVDAARQLALHVLSCSRPSPLRFHCEGLLY